jgi:OOP family OmpA-OmpF porin
VRRARAVVRYFVEHGVAMDRLESRGAADSEPIDSNQTEAGRTRNRRIEVKILAR